MAACARHDPLTDLALLRNIDALESTGYQNPEVDQLRCRLQPVVEAEFATYGVVRGWVYNDLVDLSHLDSAGPWAISAKTFATLLAKRFADGISPGSSFRPDWIAESAAALTDAGQRFGQPGWTAIGHALAQQLISTCADPVTGFFSGAAELSGAGPATVNDPLVKVGSQAQRRGPADRLRRHPGHRNFSPAVTGITSLQSPHIGIADADNGGWFYALNVDGASVRKTIRKPGRLGSCRFSGTPQTSDSSRQAWPKNLQAGRFRGSRCINRTPGATSPGSGTTGPPMSPPRMTGGSLRTRSASEATRMPSRRSRRMTHYFHHLLGHVRDGNHRENHRNRDWLPGRSARRLYGADRARRPGRRRRRSKDRGARRRDVPRSSSPGWAICFRQRHLRETALFSTSLAQAAEFGDVHFICVGTPQRHGSYAADLQHIDAVVQGLAPPSAARMPGGRANPPFPWERPAGWPRRWLASPPSEPAPRSPGTPNSYGKVMPSTTPCTLTGWSPA